MGKVGGEAGGSVSTALARMGGHRVYLDTNVFVYFLDRNPVYFPLVAPLLKGVEAGAILGCTGDAAIAETLIKPYRSGDPALAAQCKAFFHTEGFLTILAHDAEAFDLAAQLRAQRGMKFIDALHYATALRAGCAFFVTNDAAIQPDPVMEVISLA